MNLVKHKPRGIDADEWALNIEAQKTDYDNAKFAKASPARKRVIIAKDVLEWLGEGKLVATPGTYLSHWLREPGDPGTFARDENGQLISGCVLPDRVDGGKCSACALGAVFACAVEREGGLPNFWMNGRPALMHNKLSPYFDVLQLQLIEAAFEKNLVFYTGPDRELAESAEMFGHTLDPKARMVAIMKNIIRNRGTFVPTDLPAVPA